MVYLATFFTHFDAIHFARTLTEAGETAKARPVPRSVSSSCGTAVEFTTNRSPNSLAVGDVDRIYRVAEDGYHLVHGTDH